MNCVTKIFFNTRRNYSTNNIKVLTSLTIKQQKLINSAQLRRTELYLKSSKASKIYTFLQQYPFLIVCCFTPTPTLSFNEFLLQSGFNEQNVLVVSDFTSCQKLVKFLKKDEVWLAEFFSGSPIYVFGCLSEPSYLDSLKKLLKLEEDAASKLVGVLATKEDNLFINLQQKNTDACLARALYKKWDSKEFILFELLSLLNAPASGLTSTLNCELISAASLSLPNLKK